MYIRNYRENHRTTILVAYFFASFYGVLYILYGYYHYTHIVVLYPRMGIYTPNFWSSSMRSRWFSGRVYSHTFSDVVHSRNFAWKPYKARVLSRKIIGSPNVGRFHVKFRGCSREFLLVKLCQEDAPKKVHTIGGAWGILKKGV